jgi:hypothetical protein
MESIPEPDRQGFIDEINDRYKLGIKNLTYDPHGTKNPENPGYTYPNGDVVINPKAFEQSYAGLVGSVWHEAYHVWQYNNYRGRLPNSAFRDGTQTTGMMEAEAYRYMGSALNPAFEMYSYDELGKIQNAFQDFRSQLNDLNQLRVDHYDFNCARMSCED